MRGPARSAPRRNASRGPGAKRCGPAPGRSALPLPSSPALLGVAYKAAGGAGAGGASCLGMSDPGSGAGGGPGGGGEEGGMEVSGSAVQNVADVSVLQKHLRKLVPLLLEDGGEATAVLEAALEEKGAVEHMRKFLSDPQVHTVLVERSTLKGEARARSRRHHSVTKWRLWERARDGGRVRRLRGSAAVLLGAEGPGGGCFRRGRSPLRFVCYGGRRRGAGGAAGGARLPAACPPGTAGREGPELELPKRGCAVLSRSAPGSSVRARCLCLRNAAGCCAAYRSQAG